MVDKNVFTQELKKVFTILKEIKLVEKYVKELIDSNNLNEETLNQYKRDLDYLDEMVNHLQDSINQTDIDVQELVQYVDSIKDFINQNENITEIGGNLEVDGTLQVNSNINTLDMSVSGELSLPSTSNLIFEDGSTFGGSSKIYLHTIKLTQNAKTATIIIYSTSPTPYTVSTLRSFLNNYNINGDGSSFPHIYPATGIMTINDIECLVVGVGTGYSGILFLCYKKVYVTLNIDGTDVKVLSNYTRDTVTFSGTLIDSVIEI